MKPTQPPKDGPITTALLEAVKMRRQMLDAGHPPEQVDHLVGQGLKATLGNRRPEAWRFYCEHCRDTGWVNVQPGPEETQRLIAMYGSADQCAGYVVKCEPCKWTQREREKRRKVRGEEFGGYDLAAAGQTKSKRTFSKFGR